MKKEKMFWIFSTIIVVTIISSSLIIKRVTTTSNGKIDTVFGVISKIEETLNPLSPKGKSISQIRSVLHNNTVWAPKSIPFSNIKNFNIKTASNQVPVREYIPDTSCTRKSFSGWSQ